jgi:hypothetical protein
MTTIDIPLPWTGYGHNGSISWAFMANDHAYTVGSDNVVRKWKHDGSCLAEMRGHSGDVRIVRILPDDMPGHVLTAGLDRTIAIWNEDGSLFASVDSDTTFDHGMLIIRSPRVYWTSDTSTLMIWEPGSGELSALVGHQGLTPLTVFDVLDDGRILTASTDRDIRLWNSGGHLLNVMSGHRSGVHGFAILSTGDFASWTGYSDGEVRLWTSDGTPKRKLVPFAGNVETLRPFADGTFAVFGPGKEVLYNADGDIIPEDHPRRKQGAEWAGYVCPRFPEEAEDEVPDTSTFSVRTDGLRRYDRSVPAFLGHQALAYLYAAPLRPRTHRLKTSYDVKRDVSAMLVHGDRVVMGLHYDKNGGLKLRYPDSGEMPKRSRLTSSASAQDVATRIAGVIERHDSPWAALYVSMYSEWGAAVAIDLIGRFSDRVAAVRVASAPVLDRLALILPTCELALLELWRMSGTDRYDSLYSLRCNTLKVFACDDLTHLGGLACAVSHVDVLASAKLKTIDIENVDGSSPSVETKLG